jgi:iron uptake system EfeUOB component EfeO/EfeM
MRRTLRAKRLLLTGIRSVALASAIAACGHTVTVGVGRTLRVALSEYRVVPQSVQAKSGQLTLVVENDGRLTHNLALSRNGTIIAQTPPIAPGATSQLTATLTPGTYLMTSTLFSDQALGVYGTLAVSS